MLKNCTGLLKSELLFLLCFQVSYFCYVTLGFVHLPPPEFYPDRFWQQSPVDGGLSDRRCDLRWPISTQNGKAGKKREILGLITARGSCFLYSTISFYQIGFRSCLILSFMSFLLLGGAAGPALQVLGGHGDLLCDGHPAVTRCRVHGHLSDHSSARGDQGTHLDFCMCLGSRGNKSACLGFSRIQMHCACRSVGRHVFYSYITSYKIILKRLLIIYSYSTVGLL